MKKRIQLFANELGYGGIEREVIILANSLVDLYDVELVFLKKKDRIPLEINKKVKLTVLNINDLNIFNVGALKNVIDSSISSVLISTNVVFNKYIVKYSKGKRIYWEHNHHDNNSIEVETMKKELVGFDKVIIPNNELYDFYSEIFNDIYIISNAINGLPDECSKLESNNVTFVGKLTKEKGVLELLEVFKLIYSKNDTITLNIVGEGIEDKNINKFIYDNGLEFHVNLLGNKDNDEIKEILLNTSVFITCSRSESFGISLVEAMSYGIPSVVFDDVNSFRNIIDDEINGFLISDRDKYEMAKRVLYLLKNKEVSKNVGACAREKANLYDIKSLKNEWLKVI